LDRELFGVARAMQRGAQRAIIDALIAHRRAMQKHFVPAR